MQDPMLYQIFCFLTYMEISSIDVGYLQDELSFLLIAVKY